MMSGLPQWSTTVATSERHQLAEHIVATTHTNPACQSAVLCMGTQISSHNGVACWQDPEFTIQLNGFRCHEASHESEIADMGEAGDEMLHDPTKECKIVHRVPRFIRQQQCAHQIWCSGCQYAGIVLHTIETHSPRSGLHCESAAFRES